MCTAFCQIIFIIEYIIKSIYLQYVHRKHDGGSFGGVWLVGCDTCVHYSSIIICTLSIVTRVIVVF